MNTTLYLVLFSTCIVTHLQTEVLRRVPLFGKMSESHIFIVPLSKRCAIIVILLDRKIILSKLISLQNSTDDDPIKITRINNISFNIDTFETYLQNYFICAEEQTLFRSIRTSNVSIHHWSIKSRCCIKYSSTRSYK